MLVTLIAALLTAQTANGAYQTENTFECNTCITGGSVSCRPTFYDRYAFCCEPSEVGSRGCGGDEVFCSDAPASGSMSPFSCPYENNYCGASSSELEMHPETRNNVVVDIANSQFQEGALCYYQVFVRDGSLDEDNNRYFWDVEFQSLSTVTVALSNGTTFATAGDSVSVSFFTGYRFQYEAPRNQVWMSFTGQAGSAGDVEPAFKVSVRLRTFPTTSIADDGGSQAEVRIVYVEVEEEFIRQRKEQLALTVLIGVSMVGIFCGICLNCRHGAKHQSQRTKKVTTTSGSIHEIEIKPRAMDRSKDKERTAEHGGIAGMSVADGNSGFPLNEGEMEGKHKKQKKRNKMNRDEVEGEELKVEDRNFDGTKAKKRSKKAKANDPDRLSMQRDDEMNNSWDSAQHGAMKVDLSAQLPTIGQNRGGLGGGFGAGSARGSHLRLPSYQGSQLGGGDDHDDNQSYQSVRDEIDQIEDVIDGLSQAPGDSESGSQSMRSAQDLHFGKRNQHMNSSQQIGLNTQKNKKSRKTEVFGGTFLGAAHDFTNPNNKNKMNSSARAQSPMFQTAGGRGSDMRSSQNISSARFAK